MPVPAATLQIGRRSSQRSTVHEFPDEISSVYVSEAALRRKATTRKSYVAPSRRTGHLVVHLSQVVELRTARPSTEEIGTYGARHRRLSLEWARLSPSRRRCRAGTSKVRAGAGEGRA